MKKSDKKAPQKPTAKSEFRYNFNLQHKQYVFSENGNRYRSVGLTHSEETTDKKGNKRKNMPLEHNPQKGKTEPSYIRYGVVNDKKSNYGPVMKNHAFSNEDFPKVKSKIRNYKKRSKRTRK